MHLKSGLRHRGLRGIIIHDDTTENPRRVQKYLCSLCTLASLDSRRCWCGCSNERTDYSTSLSTTSRESCKCRVSTLEYTQQERFEPRLVYVQALLRTSHVRVHWDK